MVTVSESLGVSESEICTESGKDKEEEVHVVCYEIEGNVYPAEKAWARQWVGNNARLNKHWHIAKRGSHCGQQESHKTL